MSNAEKVDILEFVRHLVNVAPGIKEIWLLGSRANGTAREDSDWDLLVLGDEETLKTFRRNPSLHRADVDCLVATNEQFVNAWGEKAKSGSMPAWKWERLNDFFAEYTEKKWKDAVDGSGVVSRRRKAVQLWPNDARV
jgi:predicted nucleotidyltransferase